MNSRRTPYISADAETRWRMRGVEYCSYSRICANAIFSETPDARSVPLSHTIVTLYSPAWLGPGWVGGAQPCAAKTAFTSLSSWVRRVVMLACTSPRSAAHACFASANCAAAASTRSRDGRPLGPSPVLAAATAASQRARAVSVGAKLSDIERAAVGAASTSVAGTAHEPASPRLPLSIAFALATLDSVTRMGLDGLHLMVVTSGTGLSS